MAGERLTASLAPRRFSVWNTVQFKAVCGISTQVKLHVIRLKGCPQCSLLYPHSCTALFGTLSFQWSRMCLEKMRPPPVSPLTVRHPGTPLRHRCTLWSQRERGGDVQGDMCGKCQINKFSVFCRIFFFCQFSHFPYTPHEFTDFILATVARLFAWLWLSTTLVQTEISLSINLD